MKDTKIRLGTRFNFIETDIEIIYDVEKVKQHKQKIDNAVAEFEERRKKIEKKETILKICTTGFIAMIIIMIIISKMKFLFAMTGILSLILVAIYYFILQSNKYISETDNRYTSDIKYYLETKNKKILSITVKPTLEYLENVEIVTENKDNSISKTELKFKIIEKTNLNHIILNVNEEVAYVPYKR